MAVVTGPTPPGTGVSMGPSATAAASTSPASPRRPCFPCCPCFPWCSPVLPVGPVVSVGAGAQIDHHGPRTDVIRPDQLRVACGDDEDVRLPADGGEIRGPGSGRW